MRMIKHLTLWASVVFTAQVSFVQAAQTQITSKIKINFCEKQQLQLSLSQPARMTQILQSYQVPDCAYIFGAAALDPSLKAKQRQQKEALLSLLTSLFNATNNSALRDYLNILHARVSQQAVTGRSNMSLNLLDAELKPFSNLLISKDLNFVYPRKPNSVNLLGFTQNEIPHSSFLDLNAVYESYATQAFTVKGYLYLVQANGVIEKHRVGYWSNQVVFVSPGAWVIAPIDMSEFKGDFTDVNLLLSQWLATQVVK